MCGRPYDFKVFDAIKNLWKPRANIELDLLLDQTLDKKRGKDICSSTSATRHAAKMAADILKGPCHYGHLFTTYVNGRGVSAWQRPPASATTMHLFGAVVCQRLALPLYYSDKMLIWSQQDSSTARNRKLIA